MRGACCYDRNFLERKKRERLRTLKRQNLQSFRDKNPFLHPVIDEESEKRCVREREVIRGNSTSLAKEAEYLSALGRKTGINKDRTERRVDRR